MVNSPSSQFWLTGQVSRKATATQMRGATMAEARAASRAAASRPAPRALPTRVDAAMPNAAKPMNRIPYRLKATAMAETACAAPGSQPASTFMSEKTGGRRRWGGASSEPRRCADCGSGPQQCSASSGQSQRQACQNETNRAPTACSADAPAEAYARPANVRQPCSAARLGRPHTCMHAGQQGVVGGQLG